MGPKQVPFDQGDWETQENTGRSKRQEEQQDGVYSGSYMEKGKIWWKGRREGEGRGKDYVTEEQDSGQMMQAQGRMSKHYFHLHHTKEELGLHCSRWTNRVNG